MDSLNTDQTNQEIIMYEEIGERVFNFNGLVKTLHKVMM